MQDGTNWYVYCNNNPLNAVDPTGLREANLFDLVKLPIKGVVQIFSPGKYEKTFYPSQHIDTKKMPDNFAVGPGARITLEANMREGNLNANFKGGIAEAQGQTNTLYPPKTKEFGISFNGGFDALTIEAHIGKDGNSAGAGASGKLVGVNAGMTLTAFGRDFSAGLEGSLGAGAGLDVGIEKGKDKSISARIGVGAVFGGSLSYDGKHEEKEEKKK
ncbi:MAG TPA: hypothetical protein DDY71_11605 [Spirochaetia bacterium]|nr:hypothetical protein [Spirochaetia bacterium]